MHPEPLSRAFGARLLAGASALFLAACGGAGMSGTWCEESGIAALEFHDDGTVYVTSIGGTFEGEYEVKRGRVVLKGPRGNQVLERRGDRLEAGFGMVYVKR